MGKRSVPRMVLWASVCIALAAMACGLLPLKVGGETGSSVRVIEDIVYGRSHPEGDEPFDLVMNAYLPEEGTGNKAALLLLHGNPGDSPYPNGRQKGYRYHAEWFAKHGYVVFVVAYPFFGIAEAKAAVRHVRAKAADYGVAPDRIAMLGHSLGSNLTMRCAVTGEDHGMPNEAEKADPLNHWGTPGNINVGFLVGGGGAERPYEEFDKNDAPLCYVHGTADDLAPFENAIMRRGITQDAGIPYGFLRVEGMGHKVPHPEAAVAFGKPFAEFVDAFTRVYMMHEDVPDWAALRIEKTGPGRVELEPEHGLYPKGTEVAIRAVPEHSGAAIHWDESLGHAQGDTARIKMDATRSLAVRFE